MILQNEYLSIYFHYCYECDDFLEILLFETDIFKTRYREIDYNF